MRYKVGRVCILDSGCEGRGEKGGKRTWDSERASQSGVLTMTHYADETSCCGDVRSTSSRQTISSRSISTLTPEFSIAIICSMLNPACSPATASFSMAFIDDGFAIEPSLADNSVRESHARLGSYVILVTGNCDKEETCPQKKQRRQNGHRILSKMQAVPPGSGLRLRR